MNRRRIVFITAQLMASWIGTGTEAATAFEKFSDLQVIGASFDTERALVRLVVTSEQFAEVPEGTDPPTWEPHYFRAVPAVST